MIANFPKKIASRGIIAYCISLVLVSLLFYRFALPLKYILIGCVFILGFFLISSSLSIQWIRDSRSSFTRKLFWTALVIRVTWVIFSYFFFLWDNNGLPFEYQPSDGPGYHKACSILCTLPWKEVLSTLKVWSPSISDWGYQLWLTLLYKLFGPSLFIARLIKAILSADTCVLIYKLAGRTIGEYNGRMASIFCMLMPNLVMYCGMHLKETEMIFIITAFLERTDYVFRSRKFSFISTGLILALGMLLFTFRTVLGIIAFFSLMTTLLVNTYKSIHKGRILTVFLWAIIGVFVLGEGSIATEIEGYWEERVTNQIVKRTVQASNGNQWAKYATGTVMAPLMVIMPLSTMVDTQQYNQELTHSGNYIKNYLGCFVLIALFYSIFKSKKWKDLSLVGTFLFAYLAVLALSGYSNSERFLLPATPLLLVLAAYGVSLLNAKSIKFTNIWTYIVVLIEIGWAYFKIGGRGLL